MVSVTTWISEKNHKKFREICDNNRCNEYQLAKKIIEEFLDESRQLGKIKPTDRPEIRASQEGFSEIPGTIFQKPNNPTSERFWLFERTQDQEGRN